MSKKREEIMVVGIGASAGGLAVLKKFVSELPQALDDIAFIIVQHLDPNHKSLLSELLAKVSPLPVKEVQSGESIVGGNCYVIPPDTYLEVRDGKIFTLKPQESRGLRKAIDHLFRSMSESFGGKAAGIVLSGAGSDGTAGLRAIKAVGGLTLAQCPESADHASMPMSAIEAGAVDRVVDVGEMYQILRYVKDHPLAIKQFNQEEPDPGFSLEEVTSILKATSNFNLSQYKPATIQRRIIRRMGLLNIAGYNEYLELLREDGYERKQLTKDLLINVTDFFRDPEAFKALEDEVLKNVIESLGKNEEIRVWVAGCATGEEAYSFTILLLEMLQSKGLTNEFKIFATDVDAEAIDCARRGVYPSSIIDDMPKGYLDKYFVEVEAEEQYRVKQMVRDRVSFAVQNVVSDPPFGRMHLISCRNLLIYLTKPVQEKVLNSFYFALKNRAYLFLGSSESLGTRSDLFETVSKKWRIFQKIPHQENTSFSAGSTQGSHSTAYNEGYSRKTRRRPNTRTRADQMRESLLNAFVPPAIIVDASGQILYNHGNWKPYMNIRSGEPLNNITHMVIPELQTRIRSALYKVKKSKETISFWSRISDKDDQEKRNVKISLAPLDSLDFAEDGAIGIVFSDEPQQDESEQPTLTQDDSVQANSSLEQELAETKEELQNTVEELETSTEELKASHEEALSTNEELQSANEELEAGSEELRSLNEELSTVNAQLKEKILELQTANNDVENFFASTNVPTVFLDPKFSIQRYTPAAERLLQIGLRDIDRPLDTLSSELVSNQLVDQCEMVLQNFQPSWNEIETSGGRFYIRQVSPYRTEDRRIDGIVVVFHDITDVKRLSRRAEAREKQQAVVAKIGMLALDGAEPAIIMDQAVEQVAQTLDVKCCKIMRFQAERQCLVMESGFGWPSSLVGALEVSSGQDSMAGYTMMSKDPVIVGEFEKEQRFSVADYVQEFSLTSGIGCCINHSDPPYGVLLVHSDEPRVFTEDDANFMVSVANMLSTAFRMKRDQERLNDSEIQFRTLANSISQLAWMADETGAVNWFNKRWYDFTGTNLENMVGWGWLKLVHPDYSERVSRDIKECYQQGEDWEDTFPLRSKDGEYYWFLSRAMPIRNHKGDVIRWFGTNTDITKQLQQEKDFRENEKKIRLAMDTHKSGAFEYSLREEYTVWDDLLQSIWGLRDGEAVTQDVFWEGVHPDDVAKVKQDIENAINDKVKGHYRSEYRVVNRIDKQLRWVETTGQVLFEEGAPSKMIGMVIDITERKHLELSLQNVVAELKDTDKKKNEFLSILGHELRNPLAALSGSVEILNGQLSENSRVFQIMRHSVSVMSRLLDDLLDLNRVSQNKIDLDLKTVDLGEILDNSILSTQSFYKQKEHSVKVNCEAEIYVNADASRLEQIFSNLIINACKYTPPGGGIEVRAGRDNGDVVIQVCDDGRGLSEADQERIFDPFVQVKQTDVADSGLGIGLALARKLVDLHGGRISVSSPGLGKGSVFEIRLAEEQDKLPAKTQDHVEQNVTLDATIVLIEDNEEILATFPMLLEHRGCSVQVASSGRYGLELVQKLQPDVVLVDIGLPDMSGHEVASQLRSKGYAGLVVAISGYSHKQMREKSKAAGFDHHLAKPVTTEGVARVIAQHMG